MFKYFLASLLCFSITNRAFCQKSDTTVYFYSYSTGLKTRVSSLEEADFFVVVSPPDPGDTRRNFKEFYKNGKIKMISKLMSTYDLTYIDNNPICFDGDYVSFYPNGKKSSIAHYANGYAEGMEYIFYSDGHVHYTLKHNALNTNVLFWEWYDSSGNQICKDGNGRFINRSENHGYPDITSEGQIVNGHIEGECKGRTIAPVNINFSAQYKKGKLISAVGYDKHGNGYPFKKYIEPTAYPDGAGRFVQALRQHIKLPKDSNGKEISIDNLHLRFIVERDGQISHPYIQEKSDTALQAAILVASKKCDRWKPTRILGVPFRTEVTVPLKINEYYKLFHERPWPAINYKTQVLVDDEMISK